MLYRYVVLTERLSTHYLWVNRNISTKDFDFFSLSTVYPSDVASMVWVKAIQIQHIYTLTILYPHVYQIALGKDMALIR